MRPAKEFLVHVELPGHFEVFVIPVPEGTSFQFYPYGKTENFPQYLARRFGHLGEPAESSHNPDVNCYEAVFRGLHFKDAEEALRAITAAR